ncbi:MAG: TPM domain-containing protein [Sphingobacteriales bacterium]|nr:MAG: TPM domain-containing protein [Sphingobacteriales bacterium]
MSFWSKKPLLDPEVQEQVVACIREAELKTTGELRIFVEGHCAYVDPMERAWELFEQLAMRETERRNAILVYLAMKDRQFAIVGDEQIYVKAGGATFWQGAAEHLKAHLKEGQVKEGLSVCITELGNALAQHFPYDPEVTKNELPDEIVFGK